MLSILIVLSLVPEEPVALESLGRALFMPAPRAGSRVVATSAYVEPTGGAMMSLHWWQSRSDKFDIAHRRFSGDHGRSWSEPDIVWTHKQVEGGTLRRTERVPLLDLGTGVLLTFILQGVLPGDDPLDGMRHWNLRYTLSRDGGRSTFHEGPVVHVGEEYDESHPLPGVWIGRNSVMIGDASCRPIRRHDGAILQPVQITPLGPDGVAHNPGGGYTFHDAAVLIGRDNGEGTLDWTLSSRVEGDAARSTRGWIEPTLAQVEDGRILMLLRGSNDVRPLLPGYRWRSVSEDGGESWSDPRPWADDQGQALHSPSSCSQLLLHSSGRLLWIGNLCPVNPRGNHPRHPLVIAEVDRESLNLIADTVCSIDRREEGDPERLQLSNFLALEDRRSGDVLIHLSPLGRGHDVLQPDPGSGFDWTANAWLYRVRVGVPDAPSPSP